MKTLGKCEPQMALILLLAMVGHSATQTPQPQGADDRSDTKLPALLSAEEVKAAAGDEESRRLLKSKRNAALAAAKQSYEQYCNGRGNTDDMYAWCQRLVHAGLELCEKRAEKVELLNLYVQTTAEAEKIMQSRHSLGRCSIGDLHRARYERLDAEIQLLLAKREKDERKGK